MSRPRLSEPLVLSERFVGLDATTVVRLALEQDAAGVATVAAYVDSGDGARAAEPALRLPPGALRELARALALFAGALGVQP